MAQVPSAYQKTVPIEAGESWQSESTVWSMGYSAGAPWSPRMAEEEASPGGLLVRATGDQVLGTAYMCSSSPLLSVVPTTA